MPAHGRPRPLECRRDQLRKLTTIASSKLGAIPLGPVDVQRLSRKKSPAAYAVASASGAAASSATSAAVLCIAATFGTPMPARTALRPSS